MGQLIIVRGGGDLASGIIHRLFRSGYDIIVAETGLPTVIRRTVAYAAAVYAGSVTVEGLRADYCPMNEALQKVTDGIIPVIADPGGESIRLYKPAALVDAILAKQNLGTTMDAAPVVIGVGPGFTAGRDVHAVIETMRGHDLGRVIYEGQAYPNTGTPGDIDGYTLERLLRAPAAGRFQGARQIGDTVLAGEAVAYVDGLAVTAQITGVLRGLLQDGLTVTAGMKIGDIDPRCKREHCYTISDKARAIGGGVLEALLSLGVCP